MRVAIVLELEADGGAPGAVICRSVEEYETIWRLLGSIREGSEGRSQPMPQPEGLTSATPLSGNEKATVDTYASAPAVEPTQPST